MPVIAAFSRPGDLVAIPGAGCATLAAAVASARAAGFVYAQHIVLIHAAVDGGRLRPFPGQSAAPGPP